MPINQCTQAEEQLRRVEEAIQAVRLRWTPPPIRPAAALARTTHSTGGSTDGAARPASDPCESGLCPAPAGVTARTAAPPRRLGPKRTATARKAEKAARKASARYHKAVVKYAAELEKSAAGLIKALGTKEKKKAGAKKKAAAKKKTG